MLTITFQINRQTLGEYRACVKFYIIDPELLDAIKKDESENVRVRSWRSDSSTLYRFFAFIPLHFSLRIFALYTTSHFPLRIFALKAKVCRSMSEHHKFEITKLFHFHQILLSKNYMFIIVEIRWLYYIVQTCGRLIVISLSVCLSLLLSICPSKIALFGVNLLSPWPNQAYTLPTDCIWV